MFKNLILYRLAQRCTADLAELDQRLQAQRFLPGGASQEKSLGWVEPRGQAHGPLVESVAGQWIFRLKLESRTVPAAVVQREADARAAQIEASTGRRPGRKELRDIKDDVRMQLLPQAFAKESRLRIWLDPQTRWLVLDVSSQTLADEAMALLLQALPDVAPALIHTQTSPATAMAEWLTSQEPPAGFSIDRECELKAADESKAVVRYARHRLDIDEVQQHIREGKMPTRLALTWDDRVSFVLTEGLQIKKLTFLDGVFEDGSRPKSDDFDADVALSTGELQRLLPDLLAALGGEQASA
ncbi:MAG: recombination-associated protein RdgC [Rhodoferax sp.]